jgi:hypothetical protein
MSEDHREAIGQSQQNSSRANESEINDSGQSDDDILELLSPLPCSVPRDVFLDKRPAAVAE